MDESKGPILHVLVVGFHHKKGCQVEYSFPALVPGSPNECPPGWKYLPTLALPDGSHNFDDDTAFFHLPSLTNSRKTIYGISCFRQIPVEKLKNRTEDITRGTVQKSVCVLSSLPLYGHIEVKMSLITHAYFDEGDFSKVSLLEDTYHHLNACLLQNNSPLQNFVGLSARDFILQWRHKAVLLYKLMLLERKLIFFKSPVQPLCTTILTLLSLHPGMIEQGLEQSACIKLSRPMSPMPDFDEDEDDNNLPCKSLNPNINNKPSISNGSHCISSSNYNITQSSSTNSTNKSLNDLIIENKTDAVDRIYTLETNENVIITSQNNTTLTDDSLTSKTVEALNNKETITSKTSEPRNNTILTDETIISKTIEPQNNTPLTVELSSETSEQQNNTTWTDENLTSKIVESHNNTALTVDKLISKTVEPQNETDVTHSSLTFELPCETIEQQSNTTLTVEEKSDIEKESLEIGEREEKTSLPRDSSLDIITEHNTMTSLTHLTIDKCDIPLSLFSQGYLCLPYLSLPYIDLLTDVNVRGYIVGATNVLFKQKRNLADVLIEIDGARIESQDPELRKQLHLTTEDLRFADFVVKHVQEEKHDVFLDGVGWEGGDEWIRAQFRVYLLCLLRTSLLQEGSREIEHFNSSFMSAWKDTHNYKMWISGEHPGILEANPGHPFAGQLSVADMKLRFAHTMQNTESGRKINQAMASTGRAVATTGRAVGGAISHAKGALTNWWSNLLVSPDNRPAICEGEDALHPMDKTLIELSCQQEHEYNQKNSQIIPDVENSENIIMNGLLENDGDLLEKIPS